MKSLGLMVMAVAMVLLPFINCSNYYLITTPTSIRPDKNFAVSITNIGSATGNSSQLAIRVTVSGTPYANSDAPTTKPQTYSASGSANVPVGTTVLVPIKISNWPSGSYVVSVNGNGGALKFKRTINIGFNTKTSSLFIQTDKGIYQAGQTVKFRVISVNSELLPYTNRSLLVYINDGGGNRIKQWNTVIPTSGIFEGELPLSTQPVQGQWNIQASLPLTSAFASFTVTKYVLPRFSVTVTPPSYITTKTIEFPVTISAKYTYGQPVKGTYLLNITQTYCTYYYSSCKTTPVIVRGDFDGSATATIRTGDLNLGKDFEYGTSISVFGQVIEAFTGLQANDTQTFQTYSYDKRLSVTAPNDFRPLLPLTASIALTAPDNTPITNPQGSGTVVFQYSTGIATQTRNFTFNKDGTASVSVTPPEDATSVSITATYNNITGSAYSNVAGSLSSKFIYINTAAKRPQVGQTITISVRSTFVMEDYISYQVTGKGQILDSKTIPISGSVTQTSLSFKLTQDMSPNAAVAVFYITGCGEIVGDALVINVDGVFRTPLALQMSTNQSQPGDNITLSIKTAPFTTVALLSVDQSVLLLNSGNDLTKSQVYNELRQYGSGFSGYYPIVPGGDIRRPVGGSLDQIFQSIGVEMVTNGLYYKQQRCYGFYGGGPMLFNSAVAMPAMAVDQLVGGAPPPQVQPTRTRTFFPESWIWTTISTTASGNYQLPLTVPDTITSWLTTGFALNSKTGLGLTDQPTNLTVFKPFFLVVNLPYDVVREESVAIQVLVFNYLPQTLQVFVTIQQTGGQQSQYTLLDNQPTKNITVKSNDVQAVTFLLQPTSVGYIPLTFKATSTAAGDAIQQSLKVKAEGVPQYFNKAILVDLRNQPTFNGAIDINVPSNAVVGSAFIQFNGRGNILASVLQNLNNLVRLPSGCGEQNMVNFVPDVVVLAFLTKVNRLTDDVRNKIINFLEIGYQTELTYRRYDGSFSAFGNVDNSGSAWLTAFVVKSFNMAKSYITVDSNVISTAVRYLIQSQAADGSFQETGRILDNIQGGSAITPITLTAYVLIALTENPSADVATYAANISRAVNYLENNLNSANNAYSITIVTYALQLANSSKANEAFQKMNSLSTTEGNLKYWNYELPKRNGTNWWYSQPRPLNVEATAYALLVYSLRNQPVASQLPLVAWLVSKQSSLGGYSSTQDTVIGIQALGQTGHNFVGPKGSSVKMTVTYGTRTAPFTFNEQNELVHQQQQIVPNTIRTVQISATGNGVAIAQVEWNYNVVINGTGNEVFQLAVKITPLRQNSNQVNSYIVNVCTSYKLNGTTGMVVLQLNTLSGFIWNGLPAEDGTSGPQRVETVNGNTVAYLYYNAIPTTPKQICASLTASQTTVVNNRKNAYISIYRYYSNDDRTEAAYNLP